jgi:Ni,Fe-hydrogenase III large subunit
MGALANDVGFLPTAAFCGRLRGEYLNMTAAICGSRFGRGLVRPGGAAFDIDGGIIDEIAARLRQAEKDTNEALSLFFNSHSVVNRLEGTGRVTTKDCLDMGIVGVAARASGLARDVRADHPSGLYETAAVPMALLQSGDVFARAAIRRMEIEHSIRFVEQQIQSLPGGALRMEMTKLRANQICVALVEGWRGEIAHVAITDEHGRFTRYKIVDPSFHNWSALALALRGQQISDFPLCNKSFNLSYCGFDL